MDDITAVLGLTSFEMKSSPIDELPELNSGWERR
jgi:hypothetical protein